MGLLFDKYNISTAETWINAAITEDDKISRRCQRHPLFFIENFLGINKKNGFTITNQQKELIEAIGSLSFAKKTTWDATQTGDKKAEESLRKETREFAKKFGVSVMSCRGVGKTSVASWIILWFLCMHKNAKILVLGPTSDCLSKVLWSEIALWYNMTNKDGKYIIEDSVRNMLELRADTVRVIENNKAAAEWLAYQRVCTRAADEGQAKGSLGGFHANNALCIIEEASAVSDLVFGPLTSTLTGRNNLALMLFNPTRTTGEAHRTHYDPVIKRFWIPLQWSAYDSGLISKNHIETMKEKYGADSNEFRVSVLGLPPNTEDNCLIPYLWIEESVDKNIIQVNKPVKLLGCDIGGTGDSTMCCFREGMKIHGFYKIHSSDTVEQAIEIKRLCQKLGIEMVLVDAIGIGAGVVSLLRGETGFITRPVSVSNKPTSPEYRILRDQLWFYIREWFETKCVSIPVNENFREEISTIKFDKIGGKIVVEGKDSIRKRLGRSCDTSDSMLLTMIIKDWDKKGMIQYLSTKDASDDYSPPKSYGYKKTTWMSI